MWPRTLALRVQSSLLLYFSWSELHWKRAVRPSVCPCLHVHVSVWLRTMPPTTLPLPTVRDMPRCALHPGVKWTLSECPSSIHIGRVPVPVVIIHGFPRVDSNHWTPTIKFTVNCQWTERRACVSCMTEKIVPRGTGVISWPWPWPRMTFKVISSWMSHRPLTSWQSLKSRDSITRRKFKNPAGEILG